MWTILRFMLRSTALAMIFAPLAACAGDDPLIHFEKHVRPLLIAKCAECHSGKTPDGNLDLLSREGFAKGGMSGKVIDGKNLEASLLFERVSTTDEDMVMPPGEPLSKDEISAIQEWIEAGGPWPEHSERLDHDSADEAHWSFLAVERPEVPSEKADDWCSNEIDAFVLHKLKEAGISPVDDADPYTWLRRLCLDVTGLPPSPQQLTTLEAAIESNAVDQFKHDEIERLLSGRAYAVRQARQWLDVARYADTSGDGTDTPIPEARYYRDWVIDAFDADMPYDQFVIEQIAGDILAAQNPDDPDAFRSTIATGFIAVSRRYGNSKFAEMHQIIDDTLDTIGKSTMGLTIGCARCHHHKFDPVTQEDYYSLYGYFSSTQYPHAGTEHQKDRSDLPPIIVPDSQKKRFESSVAWAVSDKSKAADAKLHIAGDPSRRGDTIPRGFIDFLSNDAVAIESGSGRLELARRIARADNPLFARVMVNRIWQSHFGDGIVSNEGNFGRQTAQPVHHELLDYLASEFVESGWSVKHMHRLILTSRLYQLSSQTTDAALAVDEANELLWHFPRRRMDAETLRDSMLFVSGELEFGDGGRHPFKATKDIKYSQGRPFDKIFDHNRRSVYLMTPRLRKHPILAMFDGADANKTTTSRGESTVPLQALFFINGEFTAKQSVSLAERTISSADNDSARATKLWRLAVARNPTRHEITTATDYVNSVVDDLKSNGKASEDAQQLAWTSLSRSLLSSNEFIFIE